MTTQAISAAKPAVASGGGFWTSAGNFLTTAVGLYGGVRQLRMDEKISKAQLDQLRASGSVIRKEDITAVAVPPQMGTSTPAPSASTSDMGRYVIPGALGLGLLAVLLSNRNNK